MGFIKQLLLLFPVLSFCLCNFCVSASPPLPFESTPLYYADHFFVRPSSNILSKYTLNGQRVWDIDIHPRTDVKIAFNHLFLCSPQQYLRAYHTDTGDALFLPEKAKIDSFVLQYPYIFYWQKNTVGCLDFLTGHHLWTKELTLPIKELISFNQQGLLGVRYQKNRLSFLNVLDGSDKGSCEWSKKLKVLSVWNSAALLTKKDRLMRFDIASKVLDPISLPQHGPFVISQRYHYIYYDPLKSHLRSFNVDNSTEDWTLPVASVVKKMLIEKNLILCQFEQNILLIDAYKGTILHTLAASSIHDSLAGFTVSQGRLYLFSDTRLLPSILLIPSSYEKES
ncbi:MAG: hypothetical protein VW378_07030 [bacterium]